MKRAIQGAVIVVAILVLAVVTLPFLVNANQFRPRLQAALTSALGRPVTLGDLSFSLFSGSVKADNLAIADDPRFGAGPFVTAKSLDLGVNIWPLIVGHELNITDLTVTEPAINLIQNSAGQWNFSTLGSGGKTAGTSRGADPPLDLSAKLINVANGQLTMAETGGARKPMVLGSVNISIKDFAPGARFPFSLAAKLAPSGDIKLDGTAGPINPADASSTPVQLNVAISGVDLAGITANSGVAGLLSIDGSATIDGPTLDSKGKVRIERAVFVRQGAPAKQPVELDFTAQHNMQNHSGVLSQGDLRLGNATISLTGSYTDRGEVTSVNLHLAGSAMPVGALTGMLPPLDIRLPAGSSLEGGTASVNATITGPMTGPVVAGTVGVNNTTLKGFDLGTKVGALEKLAGIKESPNTKIQTLSANLRSDSRGTAIQNLKFVAPDIGEIDGTGTIDAKQNLDFKMLATIHGRAVFNVALGGLSGMSIPFFLRGTSTNPAFEPDVKGIAASEVKRVTGTKVGGVSADSAINDVKGLFGGRKKQ